MFFVFRAVFQAFERRVDPFPAEEIAPPRPGLLAHMYQVPPAVRSSGALNACADGQSEPLTRGRKKVSSIGLVA